MERREAGRVSGESQADFMPDFVRSSCTSSFWLLLLQSLSGIRQYLDLVLDPVSLRSYDLHPRSGKKKACCCSEQKNQP